MYSKPYEMQIIFGNPVSKTASAAAKIDSARRAPQIRNPKTLPLWPLAMLTMRAFFPSVTLTM
jgi:hypothetical protein